MDDFALFVCGVVVTLIAGMGVITSQVFMGYSKHVTKPTEEAKAKMSVAQKKNSKGPFTESHREAIRKAHLGKKLSEETKQKISEIHKGKSKPQIEVKCPHCSKSGGQSNMTRYHFDNCKLKSQD